MLRSSKIFIQTIFIIISSLISRNRSIGRYLIIRMICISSINIFHSIVIIINRLIFRVFAIKLIISIIIIFILFIVIIEWFL